MSTLTECVPRWPASVPEPIMPACLDGWEPYCGICAYCGAELTNTGYGCRKRRGQPRGETCVARWTKNHQWGDARVAALIRDGHQCVRCAAVGGLEVNHILPRVGNEDTLSCLHHLDNLETLCHLHHVEVTNDQRDVRRAARTGVAE